MNTQTATRPTLNLPEQQAQLPQVIEHPRRAENGVVTVMQQPLTNSAGPLVYPPDVCKRILAAQREIGAVKKEGYHDFHRYHYQKWEDVLGALAPALIHNGLIVTQSEVKSATTNSDQLLSITYSFSIVSENGEVWPEMPRWTALARLQDNKGIYDDKCANKCHTQAHKYFIVHFFKITTKEAAEDDSDGHSPVRREPPVAIDESKARPIPARGKAPDTWTDGFLEAVRRTNPSQDVEWRHQNADVFARLKEAAPDQLKRIEELFDEREKANATVEATAQPTTPARRQPPGAPPAAPVPPGTEGWDIFDGAAWLESLENAYGSCEGSESFSVVDDKYWKPGRSKALPPDVEKAKAIRQKHFDRISALD